MKNLTNPFGKAVISVLLLILILGGVVPMIMAAVDNAKAQTESGAEAYLESLGNYVFAAWPQIDESLIPVSDNTQDLGSENYSWNDAWIDGQLYAATGRDANYVVVDDDEPAHIVAQADYVAVGDAEDEIQSALNSLSANRTSKEKVLLIGDFTVDSAGTDESGHSYALDIPSYTILELRGSITAQSAVNIYWVENKTQIDFIGGELDGNKSSFVAPGNYHRHNGIWINRGSFINIIDMDIHDFHSSPLHTDALMDGYIARNYLYDCDYSAVHAGAWTNGTGADGTGTSRTVITRNIIDNTGEITCAYTGTDNEISFNIIKSTISGTDGIVAYGRNLKVSNNIIINASQHGINVFGVDGGAWGYFPAQDIDLIDNDIESPGDNGILVYSVSGAAAIRVRIEGGTINGTPGHSIKAYGVSGTPVEDLFIDSVTIIDTQGANHSIRIEGGVHGGVITKNLTDNPGRSGIALLGNNNLTVIDFIVAENEVKNSGDNSSQPGIALWSDASPAGVFNILISNNRCYDDQGSKTQSYGVSEGGSNSANITILDNMVYGNLTGGISSSTSGTVIRGNQGHITENSGSATINSGQTVAEVTHGLAVTPDEEKISLIPLEVPTNAPIQLTVAANATSTKLWIVASGDPGASNQDVGWSYAH